MFDLQVRSFVVYGACLCAAVSPAVAGESPSPFRWEEVPRVIAIGDVHGSYEKLLKLLRGTGLVDDALGWSGGEDHLVFVGDLIDRGPDDRAVLDLARRLQGEAAARGGRVHVLLGNHEVMNMSGDLRYVSDNGFRDFLPDDKKHRNQAMTRFRNTVGPGVTMTEIKPAFEKRFPPGYSGRINAFWKDGEYGKWLLQQPAVVMINGVVFLHGGLTEEVAALGLEGINAEVAKDIQSFRDNAAELVRLTGVPPSYADAMRMAVQLGDTEGSSKRTSVARSVLQLSESLPYVPSGPLWYRGVSNETERLERRSVDHALEDLDARAMVVGHTPTASGLINSRFGGRVYRIDVGMAYGREPLALVFEGDGSWVYDPRTGGRSAAFVEPPHGEGVAHFSEQLPEAQLLDFLRTAEVSGCVERQDGVRFHKICDLDTEDLHLRAVFQSVDERPGGVVEEPRSVPRTFRNEMASFLLDRLLQINLVPATVERTVEGVDGSLQIWLETAVDVPLLKVYDKMDLLEGEEMVEKIILADTFRALIDVYSEHPMVGMMLLPYEKRLQMADSTKAFSTSPEIGDEHLTPPCGPIEPDQELFWKSIGRDDIEAAVGRYLSRGQIDALMERARIIMETCSGSGANPQPSN